MNSHPACKNLSDSKSSGDPLTNAEPNQIERLTYSRREACTALGMSETTLWRLEARGKIRSVPGIRHKIYPRTELERFLANLEVAPMKSRHQQCACGRKVVAT